MKSWCAGERLCPGLRQPVLSEKLLYGRPFYLYLMVSNLALRFAWTYKLTELHRLSWVVMIFTLLEAFRCACQLRIRWVLGL